MTVDNAVSIEQYKGHSYAVHCQPSCAKEGKWSVWVEIFGGTGEPDARGDLLMSAEHQYNFASSDDGRQAGARLAEQLIDAED